MRSATILIGEDRIIVRPQNLSPGGGKFGGLPIRTLAHSASVEQILAEVESAMADCKIVPMPADLKAITQPLLAATGEKTWRAISRSFAYIGVSEEEDDGLVFFSGFPENGSFLYRTEAHWRCTRSSRAEMAAAFRSAAAVAIEEQNLHNRPQLP